MEAIYYVYILSNDTNQDIYIGITNDLLRRVVEYRSNKAGGFSQCYNLTKLIYFEDMIDIRSAITRERQIKTWSWEKKERLINSINPEWEDLALRLWDAETV